MESKIHNGGYLAPEVEVTEVECQKLICESDFNAGNPFTRNEDLDWDD